jgi:DNA-binding winged helix-turn-helix (wHTH) protein/tetratricopeptide (TPR) repeat protein
LSGTLIEFGPFRLDASRRLLWRNEELVAITPRAIDVLLALVEQQGQVVGKQELLERVWPDTFVEEANLSVNVSALRKVLGKQRDGRPYIETVARRGYRFVGSVRPVESAVRSLAVLPFRPLDDAPGDDTLGLGMADALITRLSRLGQVVVRPTTAVARYAGAGQEPREAGRSLAVDAVLAGRIQQSAERVRVTVQLLGVADGATLWAESFDAALTNIFDVQDAISERLARALTLRLSAADRERLVHRHTESLPAYRAFLRGRYFWNKLTGPWLEKAREAFEEAIAEDPTFALAHAGLADTHTMLGLYGLLPPADAWPRARAAVERALAIDNSLAEAHVSLAYVRLFQDWAWGESEASLRRALALNPASAAVRQWYALFLAMEGRFGEALAEVQRAQELDPLSLTVNTSAGFQFHLMHQHDSEVEHHRRTLELEPDYAIGHWALGLAYESREKHAEAIEAYRRAVELSGGSILMKINLARAYALASKKVEVRRLIREIEAARPQTWVSPYRLATVHAALGDVDAAFECLQRAQRERDHWMVWLKVDPMLETLRSDRRFPRLAAAVGFREEAEVKRPRPSRQPPARRRSRR